MPYAAFANSDFIVQAIVLFEEASGQSLRMWIIFSSATLSFPLAMQKNIFNGFAEECLGRRCICSVGVV